MTNSDDSLQIDFTAPLNLPDLANSAFSEKRLACNRYLTFVLNEKIYGVCTKSVAEVLASPTITNLPKTPKWLAGIANLRGEIITVVDLFRFWSIEIFNAPPNPKLILLHSENENEDATIAFKVDKVREVVIIPNEDIQEVENAPHLLGKIAHKSAYLYLLDMEKLFPRSNRKNDTKSARKYTDQTLFPACRNFIAARRGFEFGIL